MARSRRSAIRTTVEFLPIAIGLFLLLEMSTRLYLFGLAGLLPERVNSVRGLPQTGFIQPAPVGTGRIFDLKPDLDGYFKLVPFRTNTMGLRDREYELEKPRNTFRVAVLGASFALPAGVAIERAFHSLLEEQLSTEFSPRRFEFINFSVGMYNPVQVLAMLETRALAFDPDLILITATELSTPWFTGERRAPSAQKTPLPNSRFRDNFKKSYPVLQSFFVRMLLQRLGRGPDIPQTHVGRLERVYMNLAERWAETSPTDEGARTSTTAISKNARPPLRGPAHRRVLERLARIQHREGIPVVIIRLEFDPSEKLAVDVAAEQRSHALGIHYLDTRDAFKGTRPSDFWILEFDPHPDWRAHEIFARVIARFLRTNELLPE